MTDRHSEKLGELLCDPANLAEEAYRYAKDVLEDRWPEAEPFIMRDPFWAYLYARNVIGARWPEAEPTIMQDPSWVYWYAHEVIGARWLEAEPFIMQDRSWWTDYCIRWDLRRSA